MDEINEQTENMKQIQEALSTPIGAASDFDEVVARLMLSQFLLVLIGLPPPPPPQKKRSHVLLSMHYNYLILIILCWKV